MPPLPLDKVLALRPTNVVARLGAGSRLPVLNPRDLRAAQEGAPLLCIPAYSKSMVEGALKASRDQDAVLGLGCPHPLGDRDTPDAFVDAVRAAGDEVGHIKPLFLQAGPFRIIQSEERERALLAGAVFRYVDAGFTLISLDASTLPVSQAVAAYRELAQPALERELSVEVAAPVDELGRVEPGPARDLLQALAAEGVLPQFLRVPGAAYALEEAPREVWQLDLSVLKAVREVAAEFKVGVAVEDEGAAPDQVAEAWVESGVGKVEPAEACARLVTGAWSEEKRAALREEAANRRLLPRDLIARIEEGQPEGERARLRAEAGAWSLTVELLPRIGGLGSATRAVDFLARGGRY